jgi:hypothetical protein
MTGLLERIGVRVQSDGLVDGERLERALSPDRRTGA